MTNEIAHHEAKRARMHQAWTVATDNYAAHIEPHFAPLTAAMLAAISHIEPTRCLDVACGAGEPALTLARHFGPACEVVGIDFCDSMVDRAAQRAEGEAAPNCRFERGDAEDLSALADASFDLVTCRQGVGFVPRPERALGEFRRVLKPSGTALVTSWGTKDGALLPRISGGTISSFFEIAQDPGGRPPWYFAEENRLAQALLDAGFDHADQREVRADIGFANTQALYAALRGTAMSPYFQRVTAELEPAVLAKIEELAAPYRAGEGYRLPCAFVLATGTVRGA